MWACPANSLTGVADSSSRASLADGLTHQNEVRRFIQLVAGIFPQNGPALFCGINKGAALRHYPKLSRQLISTLVLAIMLFATASAVHAQSASQDNSSADVLKAIESSISLDPALESSSRQDPQKPPKDRKPPDQCGVTSAKQCIKDFLN